MKKRLQRQRLVGNNDRGRNIANLVSVGGGGRKIKGGAEESEEQSQTPS